jgi:hypothetical protein
MKELFEFLASAFLVGFEVLTNPKGGPNHRRRWNDRVEFVSIEVEGLKIKGDIFAMELREGQKANVTVKPLTARGHAGAIETGSARWSTSDESVISVTADPSNELAATIEGLDGSQNESVVVEFRADGKRGEEVKEVVGTVDVVCTQGDATVVNLEVGTPSDAASDAGGADTSAEPGNPPAETPPADTGTEPATGPADTGTEPAAEPGTADDGSGIA